MRAPRVPAPSQTAIPQPATRQEILNERRLGIGFILAMALILAITAGSVYAIASMRGAADVVARAHETIGALEAVTGAVADAEAASRGYALTDAPAYRQEWDQAGRQLDHHLAAVASLIGDAPERGAELAALRMLLSQRQSLDRDLIELRVTQGPGAVRAFVLAGDQTRLHQQIRQRIDSMQQRERTALEERLALTDRGTGFAMLSVGFGAVLSILTTCVAMILFRLDYNGSRAARAALQAANASLGERAHQDPLTGLPNRLLLMSRLEHSLTRARRERALCAVLFLDLDRFKAVNDTHGHAAGDTLLKQVAERLALRLRDVDTLARLGGDEFVVVLENISSRAAAGEVAQSIIERLNQPFELGGGIVARIGASIGVALFPTHASDPGELLVRADTALYRAKHGGRNTWRFALPATDDPETLPAATRLTNTNDDTRRRLAS